MRDDFVDCLESDLWNFAESAAFQTRNFGFGKWPKIKCCWNLTSGKLPNKFYYRNITEFHHPYQWPFFKTKLAFRHGNTSTIWRFLKASLWPNNWSHWVLLGIKWKVWTLSFHWDPLVFCRYQYDTRPLQSLLTHPTLWYKSIYIPNQNSQLKVFYSNSTFDWTYANDHIFTRS